MNKWIIHRARPETKKLNWRKSHIYKSLGYALLLSFSATSPVLANGMGGVMNGANSFWLCKAYDDSNKQWLARSPYQRVAINQAYDACKKESRSPSSCKTAREYCENYTNGQLNMPMWQCTAFDALAHRWEGDIFRSIDEAALGAKRLCQNQGGLVDSCYVNLLTCQNLNNPQW